LRDKLQKKGLEQFVQRVTVYCQLEGLDKVEVDKYIQHRLRVAGAENLDIFDPSAIKAIYRHSMGIPRLINILCDAALVYGYADDLQVISGETIDAVALARRIGKDQPAEELPPEYRPEEKPSTAVDLAPLEQRLQEMEMRIAALDGDFLKLKEGFETLNGGRDEKDRIILNLFKMLKRSMENRARLLKKIAHLNEQLVARPVISKEKEKGVIRSIISTDKKKTPK
jgi:general secretion pathway protein A